MRRWSVIRLLSLLSTAAPALPGDGTVRITERTPAGAARPVGRHGAVGGSTLRARRLRRRRPTLRQGEARPVVRDTRRGWQFLGALTDRLREISEAWFKAQEPTPRAAEPEALPHLSPPAATMARARSDADVVPPGDPLQRLEQKDDALARAQEIVARFLPAP